MIKKIISFFRRIKRRWLIAKSVKEIQPVVEKMIVERRKLRKDIDTFLVEFFGLNKQSKFIPKSFKNSAEVETAILGKFQPRMKELNVEYADLFKK